MHDVQPQDDQDGGDRGLHRAAASEVICGEERRQVVNRQGHALARDEQIDESGGSDNREDKEKFLIHLG